jgi:hypothetical protein
MPRVKLSDSQTPGKKRVRTAANAVQFIDRAGFCVLFPLKGVELPSLFYAAAHRMPIPHTWDKYCQLVWKLKDELPLRRHAFYAKYFKGRGSFLSLAMLPNFLALEESAADLHDHEKLYSAGRITHDARTIWEALAKHGPMATLELRHACKMETNAGNVRYKKAMLDLQRRLVVVHFGSEQETAAWASGRFELTSRAFPKQVKLARNITPEKARSAIAAKYLSLGPDASPMQLARLFGWSKAEAVAAIVLTASRP